MRTRAASPLVSALCALGFLGEVGHAAPASPESLTAEIRALQPASLVWRKIDWKYCLLEGIQAARTQQKPILLWAFINADPSEERC